MKFSCKLFCFFTLLVSVWQKSIAGQLMPSDQTVSYLQALEKPVILRFSDGELTTTFSTICRKDHKECFFTPYANGTFKPKSIRNDIDLGAVPVIFLPDKRIEVFKPIFDALSLGYWEDEEKISSTIQEMIELLGYQDYWQQGSSVYTGLSFKINDIEFEFVDVKLASGKILQVSKYPITQEQYQIILGKNPSHFKGDLKRPVENFFIKDTLDFISTLNCKGFGLFRLPTESEFKELVIGGEPNWWTNGVLFEERVWHFENSFVSDGQHGPQPVGKKKPNGFGLYDILGNVWHLIEKDSRDGYTAYGQSWYSSPKLRDIQQFFELAISSYDKYFFVGFRLIREK